MPTILSFDDRSEVGNARTGGRFAKPSSRLAPVRPGDLITAQFANGLVKAILRLERRVAVLEGRKGGTFDIADINVRYDDFRFVFDVTGSGLDPTNLESFTVDDDPFEPEGLEGDNDHISFAVRNLAGVRLSQPAGGLTASARIALAQRLKDQVNSFIQSRGGSVGFGLAIENVAGATAQRDGALEMLD